MDGGRKNETYEMIFSQKPMIFNKNSIIFKNLLESANGLVALVNQIKKKQRIINLFTELKKKLKTIGLEPYLCEIKSF